MKISNKDVNISDLDILMKQFIIDLEDNLGYELTCTSGYRSIDHPVEVNKIKRGEHTEGLAIDVVAIGGNQVYDIVSSAISLGCKRIGIDRDRNFIHLGLSPNRITSIWTY